MSCTTVPSSVSFCPFLSFLLPPFLFLPAGEPPGNRLANNPRRYAVQWDDPNFNTSSYCKNHWQWDGVTTTPGPSNTYNTDYFVCEEDLPELWQFKFVQVDDSGGFNMSLSHRCVDDMYVTPLYPVPSSVDTEAACR